MKYKLVMTARNMATAWIFYVEDSNLTRPKEGWRSIPVAVFGAPGRIVFTRDHGSEAYYMYVDTNPLNTGEPVLPGDFIGWIKLENIARVAYLSSLIDLVVSRMPE